MLCVFKKNVGNFGKQTTSTSSHNNHQIINNNKYPQKMSSATTDESNQDRDLQALTKEAENTSLKLESITDGSNENGVPKVKFVEDITSFVNTFEPPASAELMIGAFSDIFGKFKTYEGSLAQRSKCCITV